MSGVVVVAVQVVISAGDHTHIDVGRRESVVPAQPVIDTGRIEQRDLDLWDLVALAVERLGEDAVQVAGAQVHDLRRLLAAAQDGQA